MPLTSVLLFSVSTSSLCVYRVSDQNISSSCPEPESTPGQTDGRRARPPAVTQDLLFNQTRERKGSPLHQTVWRRPHSFSRLTATFPLMSISYEDTEEKNKDGFMEAQMFPHAEFSWCKAALKNGAASSKIFVGQRKVQSVFQMVFGCQCRCQESRPGREVGTFSLTYGFFYIRMQWCQVLLSQADFQLQHRTSDHTTVSHFTPPLIYNSVNQLKTSFDN